MSVDAKTTVIIASKAGRLGNRLFQSAHFMGNAISKGYRLLNPSLGEYASFFEGSSRDPLCEFPQSERNVDPEFADQCRDFIYAGAHLLGLVASKVIAPGVRGIDIRRFDEADEGDVDLNGAVFGKLIESVKLTLPMGWKFSDHAGMQRHRDQIIRYFTPVHSVRNQVEIAMKRAREIGGFLIGVHIRQEDYRYWKGGVHYYETDRYSHWMSQCAEIFSDRKPVFMVCSSDEQNPEDFRGLNVIYAPGTAVGDLHALSLCDRIMGPPSTFSMWASYAGNTPLCMLQTHNQSVSAEDFCLHFGAV
ncbi:MAG: hypothetical protein K8R57_04955 [Verrucomicrobia bacterium]|nr:hypothetical protein [Verrucomicrobiota bacterium]